MTYIGLVVVAVAPLTSTQGALAAAVGAALGVGLAWWIAGSRVRWPFTFASALALLLLALLGSGAVGALTLPARLLGPAAALTLVDVIAFGLFICGAVVLLRTLTLKSPGFAIVEASALVAAVSYSFRGHRNYPFSQPQALSDWAFSHGYDPRYVIVAIGVTTLAGLGILLLPRQYLGRTLLAVAFILLFPVVSQRVLTHSRFSPLLESAQAKVGPAPDSNSDPDPKKKQKEILIPGPDRPRLSIGDVQVVEGDAGKKALVFPVTLDKASDGPISVNFRTAGGTATPKIDYTPALGTLLITAGQTSSSIPVEVLGDIEFEPDETVIVRLTHPEGAQFERDEAVGVITNDDAALPELTIGDVKVAEGDAGLTAATFEVTLSAPSRNTVRAQYQSKDRSAKAGEDYHKAAGQLSIPPGETSARLTVNFIGDTQVEPDEDFELELSLPVAATLKKATGVGTIENDDGDPTPPPPAEPTPPTLSIDDWKGPEGNSGQTAATFHVTLSHAAKDDVKVNVAVNGRTARPGEDFLRPELTSLLLPKGKRAPPSPSAYWATPSWKPMRRSQSSSPARKGRRSGGPSEPARSKTTTARRSRPSSRSTTRAATKATRARRP